MALSCEITRDRLRSTACGYSLNQVTDVYLANYNEVTEVEMGKPTTETATTFCGMEVLSITMEAEAKWYHFEPSKDSASFTDTLTVGDSGSKYRVQTLNFSLGGEYDAASVCDIDALALGRFVAVAKLTSGNYILMGYPTPLEATSANLEGSATADGFNGISVVLSANTTQAAVPLSEAAIQTVLNQGE